MSDWFAVGPGESSGEADLGPQSGLPGVTCDVCKQTWATTGIHYPSISLEALGLPSVSRNPVAPEVFAAIADSVRAADGRADLYLPPGTDFGLLQGRCSGSPDAFIMPTAWHLVASAPTYVALLAADLRVHGVESVLRIAGRNCQYFAMEIPPTARLDRRWPVVTRCDRCGREHRQFTEGRFPSLRPLPLRVERSSIVGLDLVRVREWPTRIIASQRFRDTVLRAAMGSVRFEAIELVD